jgi:rare lipoprotein A (peptidoglycan hydrolase)
MRTHRGLGGLVLAAIFASPVLAGIGLADEPLAFAPVEVASAPTLEPSPPRPAVRRESRRGPSGSPSRPTIALPADPPRVVVVASRDQAAEAVTASSKGSITGTASWYCGHGSRCTAGYPSGLYAAAGPALRVGNWRGRVVLVSANGRVVMVKLVDCNCGQHANLIDLYRDAFSRLADPSRGLIRVTVSW